MKRFSFALTTIGMLPETLHALMHAEIIIFSQVAMQRSPVFLIEKPPQPPPLDLSTVWNTGLLMKHIIPHKAERIRTSDAKPPCPRVIHPKVQAIRRGFRGNMMLGPRTMHPR